MKISWNQKNAQGQKGRKNGFIIMWGITILIVLFVSLAALLLVELLFPKHVKTRGAVVQKIYRPDTQKTDLAPNFSGKGSGVSVITTGTPEAYLLLVRCPDYTGTAEASAVMWIDAREGDDVSVDLRCGRFFHSIHGAEVISK